MPIFTFTCTQCKLEFKKLLKKSADVTCVGSCGYMLSPQLPTSVASVTREMKDPYRGVSHVKGQEQQMKARMRQHHDRHEVEAKIDEHGIDDALKHGWTKKVKRV